MMITLAEGGTESTWKLRNGTPALDGVGEGGENGKEEIPIAYAAEFFPQYSFYYKGYNHSGMAPIYSIYLAREEYMFLVARELSDRVNVSLYFNAVSPPPHRLWMVQKASIWEEIITG